MIQVHHSQGVLSHKFSTPIYEQDENIYNDISYSHKLRRGSGAN